MKHLKVSDKSDIDYKYKYTLDRVSKMVKSFKAVGIKISEFSRQTGISSSTLYKLSSNPFSSGQLEEIEKKLIEYYPNEYSQIQRILEVTE